MINLTASQTVNFNKALSLPDENGCINWMKYRRHDGYGQFKTNNGMQRTHRIALSLSGVGVEPGDCVLHSCVGNRACCNPAHLRVGTRQENVVDRTVQGRHHVKSGENSGRAKLTDNQVVSLIHFKYSGLSQLRVSHIFGIGPSQVGRVWSGAHRNPFKETIRVRVVRVEEEAS